MSAYGRKFSTPVFCLPCLLLVVKKLTEVANV